MTKIVFQTFWDRYGKKRERFDAERAWQRLTDKERQSAISGIVPFHKRSARQGTAIPYPAAYLNQRMWETARRRGGRPMKAAVPAGTGKDPFDEMELW